MIATCTCTYKAALLDSNLSAQYVYAMFECDEYTLSMPNRSTAVILDGQLQSLASQCSGPVPCPASGHYDSCFGAQVAVLWVATMRCCQF